MFQISLSQLFIPSRLVGSQRIVLASFYVPKYTHFMARLFHLIHSIVQPDITSNFGLEVLQGPVVPKPIKVNARLIVNRGFSLARY